MNPNTDEFYHNERDLANSSCKRRSSRVPVQGLHTGRTVWHPTDASHLSFSGWNKENSRNSASRCLAVLMKLPKGCAVRFPVFIRKT